MSKEVTYETSPHWSARPWGSLGGLLLLLVGAALAVVTRLMRTQALFLKWTVKLPPAAWERMWLGFVVAAALAGAGFLVLLVTWIMLRSVRVRIRGGQIEEARGIFSVRVRDIRVETVKRIDIRQTFFQRVFGVGDVILQTSSATGMFMVLRSIKRPEKLRGLIEARLTRIG